MTPGVEERRPLLVKRATPRGRSMIWSRLSLPDAKAAPKAPYRWC
jgi:hypothetical protein